MEQQTLNVEVRSGLGKSVTRKLRRAGKLPGVLYGLGNNRPITVEPKLIYTVLLSKDGRNQVLNLIGSGVEGKHVLIKDYQVDPVTRKLLHVDLLEIDISKKIEVTVKLNFVGKALGAAEGGVLNVVEREVVVSCFPNRIPGHIDVDISALTIGDSIHLDQVAMPEGVEALNTSNPTLCALVPPAKEEEAVASLTPAAEPEVITARAPADGDAAKDEKKK